MEAVPYTAQGIRSCLAEISEGENDERAEQGALPQFEEGPAHPYPEPDCTYVTMDTCSGDWQPPCSPEAEESSLDEKFSFSQEEFGSAADSDADPDCANMHKQCGSSDMFQSHEHQPDRCAFTAELAALALKHNMTHVCLKDVSSLLRKWGFDIPKDARTILGTQRRAPLQYDGTFVHFGLEKGIRQVLISCNVPSRIDLHASIDGLPLFKSSGVNFWPISCRIINIEHSAPFVVSVYCGKGKPPCLETYLKPPERVSEERTELKARRLCSTFSSSIPKKTTWG